MSEEKKPTKRAYKKRGKRGVTALSPEHLDPLWQSLNEKLGGREGLLEAALASSNPKAGDLVALLLDAAHKSWGTKKLAKKAGLEATDIVDMFRDKKWLETTLVLHEQLPDIMQGATEDAKPSFVPCELCKGKKINAEGEPCYSCKGKGEIRKAGDKDKLSFVGEAVGLTGKRGPLVQFNQQINNQGQGSNFEDLLKKATISFNKPRQIEAVDAEVIDENS